MMVIYSEGGAELGGTPAWELPLALDVLFVHEALRVIAEVEKDGRIRADYADRRESVWPPSRERENSRYIAPHTRVRDL